MFSFCAPSFFLALSAAVGVERSWVLDSAERCLADVPFGSHRDPRDVRILGEVIRFVTLLLHAPKGGLVAPPQGSALRP